MASVRRAALSLLLFSSLFAACGGDDSGGSGTCERIGGSWSLSGTCPETSTCTVTQNGCSFTMQCADGMTVSGSAGPTSVSFANSDVHCTGQLAASAGAPPTFSGSCQFMGGSCSYSATCGSGECTSIGSTGGGSGGSGGLGSGGAAGGGGGPAKDAGAGGSAGGGGGPVKDAGTANAARRTGSR
ncbi:MAG TPA: hypothetical protein VHE30_01865 [Polyangiaceae bacterium]|nr:hypothetical protein [Polyangiaceae bacterium]